MSGGVDNASTALLFAAWHVILQGACQEQERRDRIDRLAMVLDRLDGDGAYPELARGARRLVNAFDGRRMGMQGASLWASAQIVVERALERIGEDFLRRVLRRLEAGK